MPRYADVVLPLPLTEKLTYALPEPMQKAQVGCRLLVPLGSKKHYVALILRLHDDEPSGGFVVKPAAELIDDTPIATPTQMRLWQWMADYYMAPLGMVFKAAVPAPKKGRPAAIMPTPIVPPSPLSEAQGRAKAEITKAFEEKDVVLLHGLTGSGKTEIYTHLIAEAVARGEQVLYLVPEILLTTQLEERLRRVFGSQMGVYHSGHTPRQRHDLWQTQLSSHPLPVVLGVRSSVFLPFQRLGLVVVDEEHETSYKQQEPAPNYHARNAALMLARQFGAKTLLGSATPSVESYALAKQGRYALVRLMERFAGATLPEVTVVDTAELRHKRLMSGSVSPQLAEAIGQTIAEGNQVLILKNRRGYAPHIECRTCGWTPRCLRCDHALTFHKATRQMQCHLCSATYDLPEACPQCEGEELRPAGYGTERVEEELQRRFPEARLLRMDTDTTARAGAVGELIGKLEKREADIVVGTQMLAKGLDIESVTLVGVLGAEAMTNVGDFRAAERTYQMLSQVSGRAGRRAGQRGRVIIQTAEPEHDVIRHVIASAFDDLFDQQMTERELFAYPPFARLIEVEVSSRRMVLSEAVARALADELRSQAPHITIFGPSAPAVGMQNGRHRQRITVKVPPQLAPAPLRQALRHALDRVMRDPQARLATVTFNVDPY